MKLQDDLSWVMWSKWAETWRNCVRLPRKLYSAFHGATLFLILGERLFRGQLCCVIETSSMFSLCHGIIVLREQVFYGPIGSVIK